MLFIVFLDGPGPGGKWVEGVHYIKIDTGVGDVGTPNGLATPTVVDVNGDLTADYIVAGDLRGNLWQLDVTSPTPSTLEAVRESFCVISGDRLHWDSAADYLAS